MNRRTYHAAFPAALFVVMMSFLATIFLVDAQPAFAATRAKKAAAVAATSAVDHTEARIKELQAALKITEAQQELWNNLTMMMRENAKAMDARTKEKAANSETMNAVERMKFYSQITEFRLDQMKKFIPPFEAFYGSLSDEQKKVTDTIFRTGNHGKQGKQKGK